MSVVAAVRLLEEVGGSVALDAKTSAKRGRKARRRGEQGEALPQMEWAGRNSSAKARELAVVLGGGVGRFGDVDDVGDVGRLWRI